MARQPHDQNEIVAIVDFRDRAIGKATRRESHAMKKLHRIAGVIIANREGDILVQRRADNMMLDYSASGHFPWKSTYLQGAEREVFEELGLLIPKSKFRRIGKWINRTSFRYHIVTVFEVVGNYRISDIRIDRGEVASVKYYTIKEVKRIMKDSPGRMMAGFRSALRIYFKKKGL